MEFSSWEDEPAAGYGSMRQGRSAVAAGRYGRVSAGQGVTAGQQDAGSSTAGAMTGSRTHDDGRTRQGAPAKRGATMAGAMPA